jgi:proteic killer suppression protein
MLEDAENVEKLFTINSLHYERVHSNKEGLESIRVNDQYRIEFKTTQVVSETVVTVCNIIELSNHYK